MRYSSKQSLRGYNKATQGSITPTLSGVVVSDPRLPHEMKEESNDSSDSKLIVTYNVEDASEPTQLYFYMVEEGAPFSIRGIDMFDKVEIDGTEVQITDIDSASGTYQFSTTGEHIVAYTLKDPTFIGVEVDEQTGMLTKFGAILSECNAITNVTIPNSVTTIGDTVFQSCSGLTSVTIGSGVTSIGEYAFHICSSLTSVTFNCKVIYGWFSGRTSIREVVIGDDVTSIGQSAFRDCISLTSVIISDGVTSIGSHAFFSCENLSSITIPDSVTEIGDEVFGACPRLTSITSLAITAPTITQKTFRGMMINGTLTVPQGSTGYDVWMGTGDYYLGKCNWTKVEQ